MNISKILFTHSPLVVLAISVWSASAQELPDNLILLDKIEAVVFGEEETSVITKSDTQRASLDGTPNTLENKVFEKLVYADAQKFKLTPDENAVDRYINMVQRENNLSASDIENMFRQAGYTYKEGREQLATMFAVNSMIDFKIKSRLIVPESQVLAYYEANPVTQEASYKVQRALVPVPAGKKADAFKQELVGMIAKNTALPGTSWSSPVWIAQSEIAADKDFITTLKVGSLSEPVKIQQGFELFKLLEKKPERLVSYDERYREIAELLRRPLFEKLFEEYKTGLLESASIIYF